MRLPEQRLWDWLRDRLGGHWFAERVENEVKVGTPDVYFAHPRGKGWLELKSIKAWPRLESTPLKLPNWTTAQRAWMQEHSRMGGCSWLVVQIEDTNEVLILPDVIALKAIDTWTQDEARYKTARTIGMLREKRSIDAQMLLDKLSTR